MRGHFHWRQNALGAIGWVLRMHAKSNDHAYGCDIFCLAIRTAIVYIVNTWYIF